nr:unnamed protein product [Callosobruchus chinensis]
MVWAGISLEARIELYIIPRGSSAAVRYMIKVCKILLFLVLILLEIISF